MCSIAAKGSPQAPPRPVACAALPIDPHLPIVDVAHSCRPASRSPVAFKASNPPGQAGKSGLYVRDLQNDALRFLPAPEGFDHAGACDYQRGANNGAIAMRCTSSNQDRLSQVFMVSPTGGAPCLISNASGSTDAANGGSGFGVAVSRAFGISADGTLLAFVSEASDLIPSDANERDDVFVKAGNMVFYRVLRDAFE